MKDKSIFLIWLLAISLENDIKRYAWKNVYVVHLIINNVYMSSNVFAKEPFFS